MRDNQREAVYDWEKRCRLYEHGWESFQVLSLDECKSIVDRVWREFRITTKLPEVVPGRSNLTHAMFEPLKWEIQLPHWTRQECMVLHEVAHAIVMTKCGFSKVQVHGPEFVRVLMELLVSFAGKNPEFLKANLGKVKVADTDALPWRQKDKA